jgi:hypothetical protein
MAETPKVSVVARQVGLSAVEQELRQRVETEGCPAAQFIGAARKDGLPGVRCRIEHTTLSLGTDPRTVLRWCSQGCVSAAKNGYHQCPTWQTEKDRIALGQHSLADEAQLDALAEHTWREDVTGSPHGDLTIYEDAAAAAQKTVNTWLEYHAEQTG